MLLASLGSLYFSHQELSNEPKIFKIGEVEPKLGWKWSAHFRDCHKFCGSKKVTDSKGLMQTRLVCKPCLYAPLIFLPGLYAHRSQARRSSTDYRYGGSFTMHRT